MQSAAQEAKQPSQRISPISDVRGESKGVAVLTSHRGRAVVSEMEEEPPAGDDASSSDAALRGATIIEAHARGASVRADLTRQRNAQRIIAAHVRGKPARKEFEAKKKSVVIIQSRERGRVARKRMREEAEFRKEDPQHRSALAIVTAMLKINEGPKNAPRIADSWLSLDFVDDFDLGIPGKKHMSRGIKEYLHSSMTRKVPTVLKVTVPLWATHTTAAGSSMETTVEREVMLLNDRVARMEYTVRHGQTTSDDRICRRKVTAAQHWSKTGDADGADNPDRPKNALRESFAKLDSDGSGHLSINEIMNASSLLGLRFKDGELQEQLLVGDNDGDGTFELHELDAIIKKDEVLDSIGMEQFNRPLIFEVLPLVARTFDAHSMVEACLHEATVRDRNIIAEQRRARVAATRDLTQTKDMLALRQVAKREERPPKAKKKPKRRQLAPVADPSPAALAAQRAVTQSTLELASIVESFEERLKERAESVDAYNVDVKELAAYESASTSLDEVCGACNQQRARLASIPPMPRDNRRSVTFQEKQSPLRRTKSSAFMPPRRPHALPPLHEGGRSAGALHLRRDVPLRERSGIPASASVPVIKTQYESHVESAEMVGS